MMWNVVLDIGAVEQVLKGGGDIFVDAAAVRRTEQERGDRMAAYEIADRIGSTRAGIVERDASRGIADAVADVAVRT